MLPSHCGKRRRLPNSFVCARHALTLLELVIVLAILAVLTSIAVRSLEPMADQARYEGTQRTISSAADAFLYSFKNENGGMSVSGFVADIGRLPQAVGLVLETQCAELYDSTTLPPFAVHVFNDPTTTNDETISVAAGWRGSYLTLPPGALAPLDGWGNPFVPLNALGNPCAAGDAIRTLASFGSNATASGADTGYARDQYFPSGALGDDRITGTIPIIVVGQDGNPPTLASGEAIRVHLYGPNSGNPDVLHSQEVSPTAGQFIMEIPSVSVGPRVVCAMVTTGTSPTLTATRTVIFRQIMVTSGMNGEQRLVVSNP